jgi:hypothetical protein
VHHATGVRVRDLPITLDRLLWPGRAAAGPTASAADPAGCSGGERYYDFRRSAVGSAAGSTRVPTGSVASARTVAPGRVASSRPRS